MNALVDTSAALFLWVEPHRLTQGARACLEDAGNRIHFSQISTWEIVIKFGLRRLYLPESPSSYIPDRIRSSDLTYVPIEDAAIHEILNLPSIHGDPFDRLLISTARILDLPIITADPVFKEYPVEVIW